MKEPARQVSEPVPLKAQMTAIRAVAEAANGSLDLQEVLKRTLEAALAAAHAETGSIYLLDPEGSIMRMAVCHGSSPSFNQQMASINLQASFSEKVLRSGSPRFVDDVETDPILAPVLREEGIRCLVSLPIVFRGKPKGIMYLGRRTPTRFDPEESEFLATMAHQVAMAIENARLHQATQRELAERLQAEKTLSESEDLFHSSIDALDEWLHVVDGDLRHLYFNRPFLKICEALGLPANPLGKRIQDVFPFLPQKVYDEYRQVLATGQPCITEETNRIGERTYHTETRKIPIVEKGQVVRIITVIRDLTKRHLADEALRESEAKYRTLFEAESDALFLIDNESGRILEVNAAATATYGFSREEMLRLSHADLSAQPDETRRATLSGAQIVPLRYHRKKDGSVFIVEITAHHFTWQGRSVHLAAIRDITERKRTEAALRESEERFRTLFEFAPDAYFLMDMKGTLVDGNRAAERMSGYDRRELIGKTVFESGIMIPEESERAVEILERSSRGLPGGPVEITLVRKDGQSLTLEIRTLPMEIGTKRLSLGIARDITESKRTDAALRESEERFRTLFEFAPDACFLVDLNGLFITGNKTAEKMSGYRREELIGKRIIESGLFVAEERTKAIEILARNARGLPGGPEEITFLRKDGASLTLEIHTLPVETGGQRLLLGIARDITERKRSEAAMRDLSHRLLQAQEEERRRIARDLHDSTAQKMAALIMALGRLEETLKKRKGSATPRLARECLSTAEDCVQEIRTVSHLLHPPLLEELGLEVALDTFAKDFTKQSGIQVTLDVQADLGRLPQETELALFRVVQEGLSNIYKHAGSPEAVLNLKRARDGIVLEILDRGRGIPPEQIENLRKRRQILGMGIASMRERIEPLGGRLEIESSPAGTAIRALVPLPPERT